MVIAAPDPVLMWCREEGQGQLSSFKHFQRVAGTYRTIAAQRE
jgi:hypothetical protein